MAGLSAPKRVLIAGYGFVGETLGRRLLKQGQSVWGIRRHSPDSCDGARIITADLNELLDPSRLPDGLDYVVYLLSTKERTDEAYRRARVDGLAHLIEALTTHGSHPTRLLFASSTGVYAESDGHWVDEDTPVSPSGFASRRLLEGESLALSAPFPATVVRFSGIYGAGRLRLLRMIARGEPTCSEGPPAYSNRIHVEDCAAVLEHLMQIEDARDLYLASDDEPVDRCELARWLADALGVPLAKPLRRKEPHADRSNKRCSNRRLRESGYRFLYPTFREGYGKIIQEEMSI